ncbi:30S ribosomal protein S17 [Candidatus Nomurabacteria bacterium]|uniref:Small ribosomal subunit protein uS17 n=1 Tax=Candidatus Dojkabacteria bacterium TaxID=2099670 RepID=A0A955I237_9BACT|nr:30S ribosomal protein S17 [Candidatus Dojkabacteria bacterium]MCB9789413.1 30S ribosomal protein S17 [Candidatus Nomurabacteria bacterium]MCB9803735.1 30S ribosomal protein S17 [Candidatus Nomurabacteria bacterium]
MALEQRKNKGRELQGTVVSTKMQNTVKVVVEAPVRHPVYHKIVSSRNSFMAHNEMNVVEGDTVVIRESRPYSKTVRWVVVKVLDK